MKKLVKVLMLLVCAAVVAPCTATGSTSLLAATVTSSANNTTLFKRTAGGAVVKKSATYENVEGVIYVTTHAGRFVAYKSHMAGYDYCVDLGGKNNVWYFNL